MYEFKQILVPVDFSAASEGALRCGRAMAQAFSARLHLLHIVEDWVLYGGLDPVPPEVRSDLDRSAWESLRRVAAEEPQSADRTELCVRSGNAFVEILRYAKEKQIDLIVIGSHGHGPIAHMLMGSVAERVVRKAPCPVLTVRDPEHEYVAP